MPDDLSSAPYIVCEDLMSYGGRLLSPPSSRLMSPLGVTRVLMSVDSTPLSTAPASPMSSTCSTVSSLAVTPLATTRLLPVIETRSVLCRVCHSDDEEEALLSVCECTGTMAATHASCLESWIKHRPYKSTDGRTSDTNGGGSSSGSAGGASVDDRLQCELCHAPYQITIIPQLHCDPRLMLTRDTLVSLAEVVVLVVFLLVFALMVDVKPLIKGIVLAIFSVGVVLLVARTLYRWKRAMTSFIITPTAAAVTVKQSTRSMPLLWHKLRARAGDRRTSVHTAPLLTIQVEPSSAASLSVADQQSIARTVPPSPRDRDLGSDWA